MAAGAVACWAEAVVGWSEAVAVCWAEAAVCFGWNVKRRRWWYGRYGYLHGAALVERHGRRRWWHGQLG